MEATSAQQEQAACRQLVLLPQTMAICRMGPGQPWPRWARRAPFVSITRTEGELSLVCPEESVPDHLPRSGGWRALMVQGPLDLSLTGVLASLAAPLARAGVSIFAISTHDTDYLLVPGHKLATAVEALRRAGHRLAGPGVP